MRDSRVRVRITPDTRTFADTVRAWWENLKRVLRRVARFLAWLERDKKHPPSPERLWIRERGRAELAEAELWFARHIAKAAA